MIAEGMSERFIRQLAKEKIKCCVQLSKAHQHRQASQEQPTETPITGSEKDAYDTKEETTTPDATTTRQLKSETSKSQTMSDTPTTSALTYSQMQTVSKTSKKVTTKSGKSTSVPTSYTATYKKFYSKQPGSMLVKPHFESKEKLIKNVKLNVVARLSREATQYVTSSQLAETLIDYWEWQREQRRM
uniref:Uncharacterized protein n=1 Tax=Romanomermis culicivorax TaxID=13658 RepID=A0A915KG20_ROMCU